MMFDEDELRLLSFLQTFLSVGRSSDVMCLLRVYVAKLLENNAIINLVGKSTINHIWTRHVLDCVQLVVEVMSLRSKVIYDLGSGAGLPGIIVALILQNTKVVMIEKSYRKALFLQCMVQELNLSNAIVIQQNITCLEDLSVSTALKPDCIVARAFKSLEIILSISLSLTSQVTFCMLKGKSYMNEIIDAKRKYEFEYSTKHSIVNHEGVILVVKNVKSNIP